MCICICICMCVYIYIYIIRTYMLQVNPHITNWVPIAVPLDKWIIWRPPRLPESGRKHYCTPEVAKVNIRWNMQLKIYVI